MCKAGAITTSTTSYRPYCSDSMSAKILGSSLCRSRLGVSHTPRKYLLKGSDGYESDIILHLGKEGGMRVALGRGVADWDVYLTCGGREGGRRHPRVREYMCVNEVGKQGRARVVSAS